MAAPNVLSDTADIQIRVRYRDLSTVNLIGHGSFGEVYEMIHRPTQARFAVKRIPEESVARLYENRTNPNIEVMDIVVPRIVGESPYLIKYYGALQVEGAYWVLSELMDTSLDAYYTKIHALTKVHEINQPITDLFLSKVAFNVLSGIIHLRGFDLIHRDIKPSNILINRDGSIKLCDFGISGRLVDSVNTSVDRGCRLYMPPEKLRPDTGYTVKSDIWSLGISLIEIADGAHPYKGQNFFQQMNTIERNEPPTLINASAKLKDFLKNCLKKNHAERWSPQQLLDHDFIKDYQGAEIDKESVRHIIDLIHSDRR